MKRKTELRDIKFITNFSDNPQGSVLAEYGRTKVLCSACSENKVPFFLKNTGKGWLTSEYSMLPQAGAVRKTREISRGKADGRSQEIQRLIGRSLRQAVDMDELGERTLWIDCDVLEADGGTRTCSISGGFVALCLALKKLYDAGEIKTYPVKRFVASVSVGMLGEEVYLDLDYKHDSSAAVDMNVVMDNYGRYIEIQGTGEKESFSREELLEMLSLAQKGIEKIISIQKEILGEEITALIEKNSSKETNTLIPEIMIATSNKNKETQIKEFFSYYKTNIKTLRDYGLENTDIAETGSTFEENSLIKASEYSKLAGKITLSEDSGLEVEYLDGRPGIYSKRYGGENTNDDKNIDKLLKELKGTLSSQRKARFVCVMTLYFPDGQKEVVTGECYGQIGFEKKGKNGFGYDPIFIPDENNKNRLTFGQMKQEEKNEISHRGRALEKIGKIIEEKYKIEKKKL